MKIQIDSCYSWIGYHIADCLLEEGFRIYAGRKPETEAEEHLAMFLGRNDLFNTCLPDENPPVCIEVHCDSRTVTLRYALGKCLVRCPYLIGEWMPMATLENMQEGDDMVHARELAGFLIQCLNCRMLPIETELVTRYSNRAGFASTHISASLSDVKSSCKLAELKQHARRHEQFYTER